MTEADGAPMARYVLAYLTVLGDGKLAKKLLKEVNGLNPLDKDEALQLTDELDKLIAAHLMKG